MDKITKDEAQGVSSKHREEVNVKSSSLIGEFLVGDVIVLGKSNVFKFNFPTEAAKLREKRRSGLYSAVSNCLLTYLPTYLPIYLPTYLPTYRKCSN